MQPDNKHKIFSKEELFKLLDEKKSLPPEADDFDKEALEGLSLVSDRKKLDGLNNSIDEVLRKEKVTAKKRKNIYFLSVAASLILIIGLFFIVKDNSFEKKESVLAENTNAIDDVSKEDQPKSSLDEKTSAQSVNTPVTTATGEANRKDNEVKEEKKPGSEITVETNKAIAGGDVAAGPPAEVADKAQVEAKNKKLLSEGSVNDRDVESGKGARGYKTLLAKEDQLKREEEKNTDGIIDDKEKEKDKTRYLTNTVWTSTPASGTGGVVDESKNKSDDYRSKTQESKDANGAAGNNNTNISVAQKSGELAVHEKESGKSAGKKRKSNKAETAKPDSIVTDMLAGYSYNEKKPESGILQGGEPQRTQQITQPVQAQNEAAASGSAIQNPTEDIPTEQRSAQDVAGKKGGKHESQPDSKTAAVQNSEAQSSTKGNATLESAEFNGGAEALHQYIKKNLKISSPKKSGTIVAEFIVTKEGKIDTATVKVTTKIKDCRPCSEDVKELVKTMPKWKPAIENGKASSRKQKISVEYNADAAK